MKNYQWILFDADETLFHFDAFSGLQRMFSLFDMGFTKEDYLVYQTTNQPLWIDYQNGKINAQQLQEQRFNAWVDKLKISASEINTAFLNSMADICMPLDGAANLLNAIKGKSKMGIITNGFTEIQQKRLDRAGFNDHFELLVISEKVGFAKPHLAIFEHALDIMGNPARDQVLMVGDTPESDILGGINAGLDTCWLNVDNKVLPKGITPKYQVSSLVELQQLLLED